MADKEHEEWEKDQKARQKEEHLRWQHNHYRDTPAEETLPRADEKFFYNEVQDRQQYGL